MLTIGKNDRTAEFEKLYFENYSYLCRSIYRFVLDENITKDIVQDVFLKYWQKIHELTITESPISYLRKACIHQALNYLKERERRENRENVFATDTIKSGSESQQPDVKYEAAETSTTIQQAIEHLSPACKTAFLLSRHEEKSYKEIAALMSISVNTVEKHIGKALRILRAVLKNN